MTDMALADPCARFNPFVGCLDKGRKIIVGQRGWWNTFAPTCDSGVLHGGFSQIKKAEPERCLESTTKLIGNSNGRP